MPPSSATREAISSAVIEFAASTSRAAGRVCQRCVPPLFRLGDPRRHDRWAGAFVEGLLVAGDLPVELGGDVAAGPLA